MSTRLLSAILALTFAVSALADGKATAKKLGLEASGKASKQWERVFGNPEKIKEIGVDYAQGYYFAKPSAEIIRVIEH